ncbi:MAG: error-prone DNA polymerase [Planctomycetota bacterium]
MPDEPQPKSREHPSKRPFQTKRQHWSSAKDTESAEQRSVRWHQGFGGFKDAKGRERHRIEQFGAPAVVRAGSEVDFAELCCTSNFTFLTGASHPDEIAKRAAELGYRAFGVCDTNSVTGVVRAHVEAERHGIRQIVGSRVVLACGLAVYVWPTDLAAYGRLTTLLTIGKLRAKKGACELGLWDLLEYAQGQMLGIEPPPRIDEAFVDKLRTLRDWCGGTGSLSLLASRDYGADDEQRLHDIARLSAEERVPMLATNRPLYHCPSRRLLQDVLACIRHGCTLDEAGMSLKPSAERHMKVPEEMARLFGKYPRAIERSVEVASRCRFRLTDLKYQYPSEVVPDGETAMSHLTKLARAGLSRRFPEGPPEKVRDQFEHELVLIDELNLPHYFLTVEDLVRWSREQGILCQGRGAAANSIVCYSLGVTDADPRRINTLFERFISRSRNEPPDIDIDFEHERREEAIQYLYTKYGRDRAALTANVITYRGRMAVREVGKALGFGEDVIDRLAKGINWWKGGPIEDDELDAQKLNPHDPTVQHFIHLSQAIQGFPRHLSQHPGGFVLTETPLHQLVPVENAAMEGRTVIEWDKDDIDALGFIKVDVLALGMLTCMAKGFELLKRHAGIDLSLGSMPEDCEKTFDMICAADTMGTFQIESRAQMSMLPRLKPRCFYDLVIEVAIVRPGPIQGGMVHPYLRRRDGIEEVPDMSGKAIEWITKRTFGVPIFQEQAMLMAVHCAGFTPDEADGMRRAVTGFRRFGDIDSFEEKIVQGMIANGYERAFAERCFKQIQGFSTYGFPESHAASFALIAYASNYFKCHWPGVFLAAILNSQPMGFYKPAQLVQDAQRHGVTVLPVDVLHSDWNCTLTDADDLTTVRLGMNRVKGLRQDDAARIVRARHASIGGVEQLWRESGCTARSITALAKADAFGSLGLDRQSALWHAGKLRDADEPLFAATFEPQHVVTLPALPPLRHVLADYAHAGLSLKNHPMRFLRDDLATQGVVTADQLADESMFPSGRSVAVAGICLVRQRPGSAKSITFMTLEDETGMSNLVVYPNVFDRWKRVARDANAMLIRGRIDRHGEVVHVVATTFESLDHRLLQLRSVSRNYR